MENEKRRWDEVRLLLMPGPRRRLTECRPSPELSEGPRPGPSAAAGAFH